MSKISCNTIKDLLPLYIDGVCSSDSIDIIEEHLKECPLCEAELVNLQNNTDIKPEIDKDVDKAVKTANKKIKKGKKKAVIKTLSLVMSLLLVIGIAAYLVVPIKVAYHDYCNDGYLYSLCGLIEIDISNKQNINYHGKYADVYIPKALGKYTTTEIETGNKIVFEDGKELYITYIPTIEENVRPFYEEVGMFGIGGGSNFPYFNPIIKKGLENMGLNPDTLYADNRLYTMLLHSRDENWTDHKVPLNPKEFTMWYTYFTLFTHTMPHATASINYYMHAENDDVLGWGWSGFNEELGNKYMLCLQPKDDIYKNYNFIFTGFQREDMLAIAESIVLK